MLKIKNLKKNYPEFKLECSMEVKKGYITGFVGKNGAGKSTTIKSVLGLIKSDSGTISLFGKDIQNLTSKDKERLGVVLNDSGFSSYFTIIDISKILKSAYKDFNYQYFLEKCRKYNLPLEKKLRDFSTGMHAKLKIIIALSHNADFLILDEPTIGLDVSARYELLDMLRNYINDNRAILLSSHISSDLENLCDDIYLINNGKILLHEDTNVLLDNYGVLKVDDQHFNELDKSYIIHIEEKKYGYACLTNQRQFYIENYPSIVIEKGHIDDLILMIGGEN